MRTRYCGELGAADAGSPVVVCGWVDRRRTHGEHLAFLDVRDHTGVVQCVVDERIDARSEYVVRIAGVVRERPEGTANPALATGEIEIGDCSVEILKRAEPIPIPLQGDVDENLRLRYRYLDLRRARMQRNLRIRARVNAAIREAMDAQGFVEVETPMLVASTPEGARDFVVPSRLHPGNFYALPQSPQLFKQLCMVGGLDRYYQIARCLRDEDLRADRQFEFMQLDAEAAFVGAEEVIDFITTAVSHTADVVTGSPLGEVPIITWNDAMERYGSDKPDTRFGMELVDCTDLFAGTQARVFQVPCVKGITVAGGADMGRNRIDELTATCKRWGAKGLAWFRLAEGGEDGAPALDGALCKFMSPTEQAALPQRLGATAGDMIMLIADERRLANRVLGLLRLELGRPPVSEGGLAPLWVVEFPLFEDIDEAGNPQPAHHPFTMPHPDDLDYLVRGGGESLLRVRSQAYDLVINGWELGSGSVRIHDAAIQKQVFATLGIDADEAERRFGFLLEAFGYGAPPHAGFAFGIDRLAALLAGEENIREVIAFPKTQSGADPLTSAPGPVEPAHLAELGLRLRPS
ncbi:MAG: aspartate--tRNA ligase [Acidimicrobiia bacterium]|nr:aspartate--tRNA ligase [Acidimicrobiia bacterium]MYC45081.1 aspartate--tRNA ligase [Acidimicrobiia bacterium]